MDMAKKVTVTVTYENETGEHEKTREFRVTMGMVPPEHIFTAVQQHVGLPTDDN